MIGTVIAGDALALVVALKRHELAGVGRRLATVSQLETVVTRVPAGEWVVADAAGQVRQQPHPPGTVDSPSLQQRLRDTGDYDAAMKAFVARQPMGRLGEAEEIADLVVYLASDETRYMTGQCVAIDGGMTM